MQCFQLCNDEAEKFTAESYIHVKPRRGDSRWKQTQHSDEIIKIIVAHQVSTTVALGYGLSLAEWRDLYSIISKEQTKLKL